jgi:hypothetical protein
MTKENLSELLRLKSGTPDWETQKARMYIHLPWIGPLAYLHTIFEPADKTQLERASREMGIPSFWQGFLAAQNGANLYLHSLYILGVFEPKRLQSRRPEDVVAFDIEKTNKESKLAAADDWLQIGIYGHDASRVLLSRTNQSVQATDRAGKRILAEWRDVGFWLREEIFRLSLLFSPEGRLLCDERLTLPSTSHSY